MTNLGGSAQPENDEFKGSTPQKARFTDADYEEDDYLTHLVAATKERKMPRTPVSTDIIDEAYDFVRSNKRESSSKKLSSTTPTYKGNPDEDLEEWKFVIRQCLKSANIHDENEKLAAITTFVKGSPLTVLRNYLKETERPELEVYFKELDKLLPPSLKLGNLKNRIYSIRQGSNFDEFYKEFQKLKIAIESKDPKWDEDDTLFAFTRAVKPDAQFELEKAKVTTFKEAYELVSELERCEALKCKQKESNHRVHVANVAYKTGYKKKDDQKGQENKSKSITCYKCQKKGHIAKKLQSEHQQTRDK